MKSDRLLRIGDILNVTFLSAVQHATIIRNLEMRKFYDFLRDTEGQFHP